MISDDLISVLVCPASKKKLSLLKDKEVDVLNEEISSGNLKNVEGNIIGKKLDQALITEDRKLVYKVINDIPILLIEEGIPVNDFL